MIKKIGAKYYLYKKDGSKKIGGPYSSKAEALKRERQVEYFANKKAKSS
jgi:hypothetical protein